MSNKKKTAEKENTSTEEKDKAVENTEVDKDTVSCGEDVKSETKPKEKTELEKAEESIASLSDRLMRTAAEFDNYKKRSAKEKNEIYGNAVCDTVAKLLPVLDNLERATISSEQTLNPEAMLEGIKMVKKQFADALADIGVAPIESVGEPFDPEKHNAVMTEESDKDENTVIEEFMKGYTYKDKIVRHSMVKVSS